MRSREKAILFHELAQLLRAGVPLARAVERLVPLSRGNVQAALQRISTVLASGGTAQEAFAAPPQFRGLDAAVLSASDKAGRLDKGLEQAAAYYEALAEARGRLLVKVAYPIFILHFAGLAFSVPLLFGDGGGWERFVWAFGVYLGCLWGLMFGAVLLFRLATRAAASSPAVDRILARLPVVGKLRRAFALSRFCLAYDMQLEAGVNVMSALETAAHASGGASYVAAAQGALPSLRAGESLSVVLTKSQAFPEPLLRAVTVGEDTGQLDAELVRAANTYREAALKRLDVIVEWAPRAALIFVAVYVGWRILEFVAGYGKMLQGIGNQ
jgi:type IV pilus assembly protein PilC